MTFSWLDERLVSHDCKDEGIGCDDHFDMKMMSDKLWFPDLYILNSRTAKNHEQPLRNGMVYLRGSGNVMLSKRFEHTEKFLTHFKDSNVFEERLVENSHFVFLNALKLSYNRFCF